VCLAAHAGGAVPSLLLFRPAVSAAPETTTKNKPNIRTFMKVIVSLLAAGSLLAGVCFASPAPEVEPVAFFDYANGELPESLAFDRAGNCFLSIAYRGKIVKVAPDGTKSDFVSIPDGQLLGVKFDGNGNLFVAGGTGIWKVTRAGVVSMFAAVPGHFFLNDMAFDRCGNMYVTDSFAYSIWRLDPAGNAQIWNTDPLLLPETTFFPFPLGPNGLILSRDQRKLYVLNTCAGRVIEIGINQDGTARTGRVLAEDDALIGADGLDLDLRGNLYVAVNYQDQIVVVSPDGELTELVADDGLLSTPTSVAFGEGCAKSTLYICNNGNFFAGSDPTVAGLLKIDVNERGHGHRPRCHRRWPAVRH